MPYRMPVSAQQLAPGVMAASMLELFAGPVKTGRRLAVCRVVKVLPVARPVTVAGEPALVMSALQGP